jgi:DNA (cytosine-5)-methyltransferase 1
MVGVRRDVAKSGFTFPTPLYGPESIGHLPHRPLSSVIKSLVPEDPKFYFSQRAVEGVKRAKPNMKRAVAQDLGKPCLTITSHLAKVSLNSRDPVLLVDRNKELYRRFSPKEAAAIQSFPSNFRFSGSDSKAYRQIGNAVPPVLMWHIARTLLEFLRSA